jgi:signal transduction histidine kinase
VSKIKIALTNILVNAIEAMASVDGVLTLCTKSIYGKHVIEVKDNGCGISKENIDKMFKVAFTSKPGGLGLGLTIVYDILKTNHVAVNIESEEGKGTTFSLLFDRKQKGVSGYDSLMI